jgi:hypothetical protein
LHNSIYVTISKEDRGGKRLTQSKQNNLKWKPKIIDVLCINLVSYVFRFFFFTLESQIPAA